ncbi:MAG TPA: hypothetical protein VE913_03540, partial [Longimicrobium sp.]|nr:hypothetical protein [Longimicrobium sp.]
RESLDQGWTVAEDEQGSEVAAPAGLPLSTVVFSFTRGGSERTVIASQFGAQGVVQLFDGCPDPAPDFRVIVPNTAPQAT